MRNYLLIIHKTERFYMSARLHVVFQKFLTFLQEFFKKAPNSFVFAISKLFVQ